MPSQRIPCAPLHPPPRRCGSPSQSLAHLEHGSGETRDRVAHGPYVTTLLLAGVLLLSRGPPPSCPASIVLILSAPFAQLAAFLPVGSLIMNLLSSGSVLLGIRMPRCCPRLWCHMGPLVQEEPRPVGLYLHPWICLVGTHP